MPSYDTPDTGKARPGSSPPPLGSTTVNFLQATPAPAHPERPARPRPGASLRAPADGEAASAQTPGDGEPVLVREPAGGVPALIDDERALMRAARSLRGGTGPMAVDAERASGYRYGQRAYLVQLKREGAGIVLIDPIACPDLSPIQDATRGVEWIVHAATQDLPCLAEVGLRPDALFDTEVGCRLLGLPRVGLSSVAEHYLGVRLAKEHSAVDWSTRPLPTSWLRYAALDVDILADLREAVAEDLRRAGKQEWARQEFEALTHFTGPAPRPDPWRRTQGMHKIRSRRGAAHLAELWRARDRLAAEKDVAPGRLLPDAALVDLALAATRGRAASGGHRGVRRHSSTWQAAIARASAVPEDELPLLNARSDAPPPVKAWKERKPAAAARLAHVKDAITAFGEEHQVPPENVVSPSLLRQVVWDTEDIGDMDEGRAGEEDFRAALARGGARPWQIDIVAPHLAEVAGEPER